MKIALLVPGGVDRSGTRRVIPFVLWLIERIARVHELHVFALYQEPRAVEYDLRGARVHAVGPRPRRLRAIRALWREDRRARFDVLHALWAAPQGIIAGLWGLFFDRPVLLHLIGADLRAIPEIGFGLLLTRRGRLRLRVAVGLADRVLVSSREMVRFAEGLGITVEPVPFGVDIERWPPTPPRSRTSEGPARLLHVGSLNPVKDQVTLLRALAELRGRGVSAVLDVVGEDTLEGRIQALVPELGLEGRVRFHGFLSHDELRPLMQRADLLVHSSRHESGPLVVQEAAVAGVPTVGTAVGHLVEWAPDAAVAVPVADPGALARAVEELLADEERRLAVARAAQERAMAKDADWTAGRILEIYGELAGGAR